MTVNEDTTQGAERGPYKMRTIARLTDFSPALLRAWERRHNLLKPLRGSGGHRLYTEDDLQILLRVKDLIRQGRSIGEIAGAGREALLKQRGEEARRAAVEPKPIPEAGPEMRRELDRWVDRIVDAAVAMDSGEINRALDESFARVAAETAIFEVIKPATRKLGDLWFQGKCTVASEHVASGVFVHRLRKLVETAEPARSSYAPVIVACFPDEYHQLGALMLSFQLARHGLRVSFLGAALPFEDLESACDVIQPGAVMLSVTRQAIFEVHRRDLAEMLSRRARSTLMYVGGQGVPGKESRTDKTGARIIMPNDAPEDVLKRLLNDIQQHGRRAF